ncbi:uncharacterized protein VP01_193g1, partial [Puccinia sorghi]
LKIIPQLGKPLASPGGGYKIITVVKHHLGMSKEDAVMATKELVTHIAATEGSMAVFTNGSFDLGKGGAGAAVCPQLDLTLSSALVINPFISNHESPQLCVKEAYIFTENKGALQRMPSCNKETSGQYIFAEIRGVLNTLPADLTLHLAWCPGHQGIVGNEAADILAGEATRRNHHPDRRLKAKINKISTLIRQPRQQLRKNAQKAKIKFNWNPHLLLRNPKASPSLANHTEDWPLPFLLNLITSVLLFFRLVNWLCLLYIDPSCDMQLNCLLLWRYSILLKILFHWFKPPFSWGNLTMSHHSNFLSSG